MPIKVEPIEAIVRIAATDVKKGGWRGVMRSMGPQGKVVVTNHNEPEAVVLSAQEYARIEKALARIESSALETLRRRFDERLASLQAPDAGDRLRAMMKSPARLDGQLKAGSNY